MKITVFWDAMQPSKNLCVYWRNLLHPSSRQSDTHSTLNKEAAGCNAMFINFNQINHCIPEEKINITSKPLRANNHECKQIPGFL